MSAILSRRGSLGRTGGSTLFKPGATRGGLRASAAAPLADARSGVPGSHLGQRIRDANKRIVAGARLSLCLLVLAPVVVLAQPSLSISDATVQAEGSSGFSAASFTVTRSTSDVASSVQFATADKDARGGSSCGWSTDYIAASGSLAFAVSETAKTITVAVCGDSIDEPTEGFYVRLHTPIGATIVDDSGAGKILDDDVTPFVEIRGPVIGEGNALSTSAVFLVGLSQPSGFPIRVNYATSMPDPTSPVRTGPSCGERVDFVYTRGLLELPAGTASGQIAVPVCGDTRWEGNEKFTVALSNPVNAKIGGQTEGTITNDDPPELIAWGLLTFGEPAGPGNPVEAFISLHLSGQVLSRQLPSGHGTVHFETVDGTAIRSGSKTCDGLGDYILRSGIIDFYDTDARLSVPICHDTKREGTETFQIRFSNPIGIQLPNPTVVVTILDND